MKINSIIVSLILIVVSCFCFSFGASAETEQLVFSYEKQYNSYSSEISSTVDVDELKAFLRQKLVKCPEYIDISAFSVSESDFDALADMIWNDMTDMFHVDSIGCSSSNGKISELDFTYYYDANTFASMYLDFIAEAGKLLNGIKGNNSLSEVEKALLLHDRLALHCEYDIKNLIAGDIPSESYLAYGAIVNCKAVCQGYSEAYAYLLEQVGIKSRICESDALDHAWNIVTIDGKEYHVDVTWDDPTYDITGNVLHTNFLRSSAGIYSVDHNASDYDTSPSDTRYDDYFWQDSDAAFQLLGDEIYYISGTDNSICRMSDNKSLFRIDSQWQAGEDSFWSSSYSRLAADGMTLLYNTADAVYSFNQITCENKIIWQPDLSAGKYYSIYGFDYSNSYLLCDVVDAPNYTLTTKDTGVQKMKYDSLDSTDEISHSFGEWTDSDNGTQIRICSGCGKTEYRLAEDTDLPDEIVNDDTSDTELPEQDETDDKTDTDLPEDNTDDKNEVDSDISEDNKLILNDGSSLIVNEEKKYVITSVNTDILAQIKNSNVVIYDLSGKEISDSSVIGTGCVITVNNIVQYNIVINCDVDGNGKVTAADARLVLRASANLDKIEGVYAQAADYDGNEKITAADARKILRKSAGLE